MATLIQTADVHHDPSRAVYRIPVEIWTMIGAYDDSPQFLSGLARACKLLWGLFTPELYEIVSANTSVERFSTSQSAYDNGFRYLVHTLALSPRLASLVHELRLGAYVEPMYGGRRYGDSTKERDFKAYRRDFLSIFPTFAPDLLKNLSAPDAALTTLVLTSNIFEHGLGKCLSNSVTFSKLKTLKLECRNLSMTGLIDVCKFVVQQSLESLRLFAKVEGGQQISDGFVQRCYDVICSTVANLSSASPNMQVLDIHLLLDPRMLWCRTGRQVGARALQRTLNELHFPMIRLLHVWFGRVYGPQWDWTFQLLYDAHKKLRGEAVSCECECCEAAAQGWVDYT